MHIERREVLLGVSGAALAVGMSGGSAEAQLSEIKQKFSDLFHDAVMRLEDAIDALTGMLDADGRPEADAAESGIRDSIQQISEVQSPDEMRELARTEYAVLADQIAEMEAFTPPDPKVLETVLAAADTGEAQDNWSLAIKDILLEAMGFDSDERATLMEILPFADLVEELNQLRSALANGEWAKARRIVERIIRKVFSRAVIAEVIETVDGQLAQKLLRSLAARAVPFLGWAWFAAAVCLSIFRNRERLLELAR